MIQLIQLTVTKSPAVRMKRSFPKYLTHLTETESYSNVTLFTQLDSVCTIIVMMMIVLYNL
jgi:hypothetical protein